MKRWIRGAIICLLLVMLSGCYKVNVNVTVSPDGTGTLAMEMLMSEAMMSDNEMTVDDLKESVLVDLSEEEKAQMTVETVERTYGDDRYVGISVTYKDTMSNDELDLSSAVTVDQDAKTITFDINGAVLANLSGYFRDDEMGMDMETLKLAGVECNMNITMPFAIESYEGGTLSSDKKTLTVDLLTFDGDRVTAMCRMPKAGSNSIGWIIGGVALVVLVLAGVVMFRKRKQSTPVKDVTETASNGEDTPVDVDENAQ